MNNLEPPAFPDGQKKNNGFKQNTISIAVT